MGKHFAAGDGLTALRTPGSMAGHILQKGRGAPKDKSDVQEDAATKYPP
jgi:hypothetical protein